MKLLDKKKGKELEWDRFVKENHTNFSKDANGIKYEFYEDDLLEFITQQRTELLEEIKTRIDTWGGFEDGGGNLCHYDSEILDWVNNLLNNKDEYNK